MLALALGGRTIGELQQSMTQIEFHAWIEFYKLNPFDDLHRYYRPAALLAGVQGADSSKAIEWLQPEAAPEGFSEYDLQTFKAFGQKPPRKG